MKFDQLFNLLTEMPINKMEFKGDWSKGSKLHDYDKASIGILQSEKGIEKIKNLWNKTDYEFDMYFLKGSKEKKFYEVGEVSSEFAKNNFGLDIPENNDDHITIIYTNNKGDDKIPMTGWTLAHRFAHALRRKPKGISYAYSQVETKIINLVDDIAKTIYNTNMKETTSYSGNGERFSNINELNKIRLLVAYSLGTFKSARDKNIRNYGEFTNELIAQYLVTGEVKFNKTLPKQLVTKQMFRNKIGPLKTTKIDDDEILEMIQVGENDINYMIESLLGTAYNNIYVM